MKKVFFVLISAAALSLSACNSGANKTETVDSTQMKSMVNEAMDSVKSTMNQASDSAANAMPMATDTTKKM